MAVSEIYCDYGILDGAQDPNGCPQVIPLSERKAHMDQCGYCPVSCPNSDECQVMKRSELQSHLKNCNQSRCKNHAAGCPKEGDRAVVAEHEETCIFALMGDALTNAISAKLAERYSIFI